MVSGLLPSRSLRLLCGLCVYDLVWNRKGWLLTSHVSPISEPLEARGACPIADLEWDKDRGFGRNGEK